MVAMPLLDEMTGLFYNAKQLYLIRIYFGIIMI